MEAPKKKLRKKLMVTSESVKGGNVQSRQKGRGKLIIYDKEKRPFFIEIDLLERTIGNTNVPVIRVHFPDNDVEWKGTVTDLFEKLIKV